MIIRLQYNNSEDVVFEYEDKAGRYGMPLTGEFKMVMRVARKQKAADGADAEYLAAIISSLRHVRHTADGADDESPAEHDEPWLPEYVEHRRAAIPKSLINVRLAWAKCMSITMRLNEYIEQNNMGGFFNLGGDEEIVFRESKCEDGVAIENAPEAWEADHEFMKMYGMQHELESRAGAVQELVEYLLQKNGNSADRAGTAAGECIGLIKLRGVTINRYIRRVNEYLATRDGVVREAWVVEYMRTGDIEETNAKFGLD